MKRNAIAGLCLATLMLVGAGLANPHAASAQTPGANSTIQVNTAPQPPLALDDHSNWSDFGESPTPTFALSDAFGTYKDAATSDNWSDFGESPAGAFTVSDDQSTATLDLSAAAGQVQNDFLGSSATTGGAISTAVAEKMTYENWSDFGESPPVERTSSALMLDDEEHANWSDFGESPSDATR